MKALIFAFSLLASVGASANDAECYTLDSARLPEFSGNLYTQVIDSLPETVCLSNPKINELERTVTYTVTDFFGKGGPQTLTFGLRPVTNSKVVQLTTAPILSLNQGGSCDEAAQATLYISAAYNTRTKKIEGQDVLLRLYYESNDNCHSAPEVDETFRYLTAKDIAG